MIFDIPARLLVAYALIVLLVLAAIALAGWRASRTQRWRDRRANERLAERYRQRREAAALEKDMPGD